MASDPVPIAGVILAGGASSRMGRNKALLSHGGVPLIEAVYQQLTSIFPEIIVVTNSPEEYSFLPCRLVADIYAGCGALAGIHAGLIQSGSPAVFVVACDMPYLNDGFIRHLAIRANPAGVVIPRGPDGLEPLHAVYGRGCLTAMERALSDGKRKITSFFADTTVQVVAEEEIAVFDPGFFSFRNINTPADYYALEDAGACSHVPPGKISARSPLPLVNGK